MPRRSTWLTIAAVLYAIFGLGLLLIPEPFMAVYGVALTATGAFMSRILGSALIGFALLFWWGRNDRDSPMMTAVLRASFIYNAIGFMIMLYAINTGLMNSLGSGPAFLHIFLALGFRRFAWPCSP